METESQEYKEHLEKKYLPFRDKYLQWFFYPKILRQFSSKEIMDLGFGTGEFLHFLKMKKRTFSGIDNNPFLVEKCSRMGFDVALDDITQLSTINRPIDNAVVDNVLEHLDLGQIDSFFSSASRKMSRNGNLVIVVPDKRGYKYDPTHKTFVNPDIIKRMCDKHNFTLEKNFSHPINIGIVGSFLYLNMQVFKLKFN